MKSDIEKDLQNLLNSTEELSSLWVDQAVTGEMLMTAIAGIVTTVGRCAMELEETRKIQYERNIILQGIEMRLKK